MIKVDFLYHNNDFEPVKLMSEHNFWLLLPLFTNRKCYINQEFHFIKSYLICVKYFLLKCLHLNKEIEQKK
jgi:hypothetical protein